MSARPRAWTTPIGLVVVAVLLGGAAAPAFHLTELPRRHRIAYQLNEPGVEKAVTVLRNIQNHVEGVGGWQNVEALELVVFGPALKSFVTRTPAAAARWRRSRSTDSDSACAATPCGAPASRWRSFATAPATCRKGGVVRLMEVQEARYTYIRP
jgi:intracellular sulfur oxidation DsrE/DsrF family protein